MKTYSRFVQRPWTSCSAGFPNPLLRRVEVVLERFPLKRNPQAGRYCYVNPYVGSLDIAITSAESCSSKKHNTTLAKAICLSPVSSFLGETRFIFGSIDFTYLTQALMPSFQSPATLHSNISHHLLSSDPACLIPNNSQLFLAVLLALVLRLDLMLFPIQLFTHTHTHRTQTIQFCVLAQILGNTNSR